MADSLRPGSVYWIDHYVVGSNDLERWVDFSEKILGTYSERDFGPEARRFIVFRYLMPWCHHGAMISPEPLQQTEGLGKGLPRHAHFIQQSDIDKHMRRLDTYGVPHLDPIRTSADGEEGISIAFEDPDGNQLEFWAPDRLPEGAMAGVGELGVGRISHVVCESQDLQRAADHFAEYCGMAPDSTTDVSSDTVVLRTVGGARVIYKKAEIIHERTGGWGQLSAAHAALVVRDEQFWPNYEHMWAGVGEWQWDRDTDRFIGAGPNLPARTSRHGSPAGMKWFDIRGRGDDWYDWDTNCFHFLGGGPRDRSFAEYEPHTMEWMLPRYVEEHDLVKSA